MMIIVKINKPINESERLAISKKYGEKFDPQGESGHGLMIECNKNGDWDNQKTDISENYYVFLLSVGYDPTV